MRYLVATVGKPALAFAREAVTTYLPRLGRSVKTEVVHVKDATSPDKVAARLLAATDRTFRVVLDERGESCDTLALADRVRQWRDDPAVSTVSFIIGGANGHSDTTRDHADFLLSLSPLTLQHELALAVLLEQLYRVQTVLDGSPYHREG